LFSFLFLKGTINAFKKFLDFIASEKFVQEYGELFVMPIKLNQDFVESFFSSQSKGKNKGMMEWRYCHLNNGLNGLMI
jgi:hypothetical protein